MRNMRGTEVLFNSIFVLFGLSHLLWSSVVESNSSGAPQHACDGMTPGHGFEPQPNDTIPAELIIASGNII